MRSASNRRQALLGLAGVTLMAGCATRAAEEAAPGEGAAPAAETAPDLAALTGKSLRVVPKGGMMTMDYREDRLTILLDEDERIEQAYVG